MASVDFKHQFFSSFGPVPLVGCEGIPSLVSISPLHAAVNKIYALWGLLYLTENTRPTWLVEHIGDKRLALGTARGQMTLFHWPEVTSVHFPFFFLSFMGLPSYVPIATLSPPEPLLNYDGQRWDPFQCFIDCERQSHKTVSTYHNLFWRESSWRPLSRLK